LVKKLELDSGLPDEFLVFLGCSDPGLSGYISQKLSQAPNPQLRDKFEGGSIPFKLAAIDLFKGYGATSLLSYSTLISAACDPNSQVSAKAVNALASAGVPTPKCAPKPASQEAAPAQANVQFQNIAYAFDGLSADLAFHSLKPGTTRLMIDFQYTSATINPFEISLAKDLISRKGNDSIECEVLSKNGGYFQVHVFMGRNDNPPPKTGFWSDLFPKTPPAHPISATARVKAYCSDGSHYEIESQPLDFNFLDKEWEKLAQKNYDGMISNSKNEWGDRRSDVTDAARPSLDSIDLGDVRPFILMSIGGYMGGGAGFRDILVLRINGQSCETLLATSGSFDMGYQLIPWGKTNLLQIRDNMDEDGGDPTGRLYMFQADKLNEVFEYPASDCGWQMGCSFETDVTSEGNKLFLLRQNEERPNYVGQDYTSEARPQKAELTWNAEKMKFEQGPYQSVNEY
jgi:hypothetical protein